MENRLTDGLVIFLIVPYSSINQSGAVSKLAF